MPAPKLDWVAPGEKIIWESFLIFVLTRVPMVPPLHSIKLFLLFSGCCLLCTVILPWWRLEFVIYSWSAAIFYRKRLGVTLSTLLPRIADDCLRLGVYRVEVEMVECW